jgi:hypothetical protein
MGGEYVTYGGEEVCVQGFGGKIRRKEAAWKTGHRWEDNIKIDLQERDWRMDWIDLPQDTERWRDFVNE